MLGNLIDTQETKSRSGRTRHQKETIYRKRPRTNVTFASETATPTLDFIATNDAAPTEQPEDVLHGQP